MNPPPLPPPQLSCYFYISFARSRSHSLTHEIPLFRKNNWVFKSFWSHFREHFTFRCWRTLNDTVTRSNSNSNDIHLFLNAICHFCAHLHFVNKIMFVFDSEMACQNNKNVNATILCSQCVQRFCPTCRTQKWKSAFIIILFICVFYFVMFNFNCMRLLIWFIIYLLVNFIIDRYF